METRSSTFSSERSLPQRGFPFAVLLALGLVAAVELGLRSAPEGSLLGYGGGIAAYYEALHTLQELGAADVAIVGSSRGREAVAAPEMAAELREALHRDVTVGNYSCPDATPETNLLVIREMIASRSRPEVVVYFLSPRLLRAGGNYRTELNEVFGEFPDRFGRRSATWLASLTERPLWELRNFLWRNYDTFRYRFRIRHLAGTWARGRKPTSPMQGSYTAWQVYTAERSLAKNPPSPEQIRVYLDEMLGEEHRYSVDEKSLAALQEALRLCREQGIPILLVEEPLAGALREAFPPDLLPAFRQKVAEVERETNATLVSMEEMGVELGPADFREQSHVNLSGARKVTAALTEQRLIPLLTEGKGGVDTR